MENLEDSKIEFSKLLYSKLRILIYQKGYNNLYKLKF